MTLLVLTSCSQPATDADPCVNGRDGGQVAVEPEAVDFGAIPLGTVGGVDVSVASAGEEPVTVCEILLEDSHDVFSFRWDPEQPYTFLPGDVEVLYLGYYPDGERDSDTGVVRLRTSDPDRRVTEITLTGSTLLPE
jgi:hypothetical protein